MKKLCVFTIVILITIVQAYALGPSGEEPNDAWIPKLMATAFLLILLIFIGVGLINKSKKN